MNVSDPDRRRNKQKASKLKPERLIIDGLNDKSVEIVFPEKNLVNARCDRDLTLRNTSKCDEEKTEDENGQNNAINLTTETNITLIDQKACLDK